MKVVHKDFNSASDKISTYYAQEWRQIKQVLSSMPLHVKASRQAGIEGTLIFDPVGTNDFIKKHLGSKDWKINYKIPEKLAFLGTDVDFVKKGLILEAQFSNYPFLLNNIVRSELFSKEMLKLDTESIDALVVIAKARMFRASNSTLYFEQAVNQLAALEKIKVFSLPVRLVGLFENVGSTVTAVRTNYGSTRARKVKKQAQIKCRISKGKRETSRCILRVTRS